MATSTTPEKREFQAEVSQVLDIVINSLYTDKDIFIRELVSNASDALEKLRHTQLTEGEVYQGDLPLEIHLSADEEAGTLTITDYGLGMTREELHENIGTIAHSGQIVGRVRTERERPHRSIRCRILFCLHGGR